MRTLASNRSLYQGFARQYDGVQNYDSLGTMGNFGSNLGSGFYCSFQIKTTNTATEFIWGVVNTGTALLAQIGANMGSGGGSSAHAIMFQLRDNSVTQIQGACQSPSINFNDGNVHTIVISWLTGGTIFSLTIDGTAQTITYANQGHPSNFSNFGFPATLGARNLRGTVGSFFACTIDNFKIGTNASNLYGSYNFDQRTLADSSGQGNNGTANGSPTPSYVVGLSSVPRMILASGRQLAVGRHLHA